MSRTWNGPIQSPSTTNLLPISHPPTSSNPPPRFPPSQKAPSIASSPSIKGGRSSTGHPVRAYLIFLKIVTFLTIHSPHSQKRYYATLSPSVSRLPLPFQYSLSPSPAQWGMPLHMNNAEPDDFLHNPDPRRDRKNDPGGTIFTLRGLANLGCLVVLALGCLMLLCVFLAILQ